MVLVATLSVSLGSKGSDIVQDGKKPLSPQPSTHRKPAGKLLSYASRPFLQQERMAPQERTLAQGPVPEELHLENESTSRRKVMSSLVKHVAL